MLFLLPKLMRKVCFMRYHLDEEKWQRYQRSSNAFLSLDVPMRNVSTFTIPDSYCFIGNKAFQNMAQLRKIGLPKGCLVIGKNAFRNCGLVGGLAIPESVSVVQEGAFENNKSLLGVSFSGELKILGKYAFRGCKSLQSAIFDEEIGLPLLEESVFENCSKLAKAQLPRYLERIERRAFYRCKTLSHLELPNTVRRIGEEAFYFNAIESLRLSESLVELGEASFFKSMMLRGVRIPPSVRSIGSVAFRGSNRLEVLEIFHDPEHVGDWIANRSVRIRCRRGSKMEAYCKQYGYRMEIVD